MDLFGRNTWRARVTLQPGSGRWAGEAKTECGLHSLAEQDGSGI